MNKTRIMRVTVVLPEKHSDEDAEDSKAASSENAKETSLAASEIPPDDAHQHNLTSSEAATDALSDATDSNLS